MADDHQPNSDLSDEDHTDEDPTDMSSPLIDLLALIIAVLGILVLLNEI